MRLTVLSEAEGLRFLWEPEPGREIGAAGAARVAEARLPIDAELRQAIEQAVDLAAEALDRMDAPGDRGAGALQEAGALVHGRLIPAAPRQALAALTEGAELLLTLDDGAARIPWELAFDGRSCLGERLAVGRRALGDDAPPALPSATGLESRPRILLVGNPSGDLPAAEAEVEALMELFDGAAAGPRCELLCRGQASRLRLLEALGTGGHALVHIAGHARPGALRLADGWLQAAEIREALRGSPLVYLNACRSGRSASESKDPSVDRRAPGLGADGDLVSAFLAAGARAVIATLWPVLDEPSSELARAFYRELLEAEPLGEALRRARAAARRAHPRHSAWAAPRLHGHPGTVVLPPGPSRHSGSALALRWTADASGEGERLRRLAGELAARGGRLARAEPGRLLAVFGLPRALEDDAPRALDAALRLRELLADLDSPPGSMPRAGLSSGRIDMDPRGLGAHGLPIYSGPAVDRAERLAHRAEPGEARVDAACARLAGEAFELRAMESREASRSGSRSDDGTERPDRPEPVREDGTAPPVRSPAAEPTYLLLGRRESVGGDGAAAPAFTAGREAEIGQLRGWLESARAGRGAVVGIVGEAGVGKSHLLRAFRAQPDVAAARWLGWQAGPDAAPYATLADLLRRMLEAGEAAPAEPRVQQLLDSLTGQGSSGPLEMQAEDRGRLLHWMRGRLAAMAAGGPLLLCLDDAHRTDEASLALLERLSVGIERGPVLLLLPQRPGWAHPFAGQPAYLQLRLGPLPEADSRSLIAAHLETEPAQVEDLAALLEACGGNPFFIEESLRDWQETGILRREAGGWRLSRRPDPGELPGSVQRTLLARCDRLPGPARRALDGAAVLAEPFAPDLLSRMLGGEPVEPALERLESGGFVEARWASGDYALRHGLIGEVAAAALLPERHRGLHRRAARAMAAESAGEDAGAGIEGLARHALGALLVEGTLPAAEVEERAEPAELPLIDDAAAEDLRLALRALERAGRLALDRYAARQALAHLRRALSIADRLPALDAETRAGLHERLGDALNQLGAFEPAIEAYRRAFDLRAAMEGPAADRALTADLARRIGRLLGWGARHEEALAWMQRGLDLLGDRLDEADRGVAALLHVHTGSLHYFRGDFDEASSHIERGLGIAEGTPHRAALAAGYNTLGAVHDAKGERERAISSYEKSLALWDALGDEYQGARVADNLGVARFHQGRWSDAAQRHEQALTYFEGIEDRDQTAFAALNLGNVELAGGRVDEARGHFEQALDLGRAVGSPRLQLMAWLNLAHAALELEDLTESTNALERCEALQREHAIEDFEAEALVTRGRLQLARGDARAAEEHAREALERAALLGLALEEALARRLLGLARGKRGDLEQALRQVRWSDRILTGLGQVHESARNALALAELQHEAGEREGAGLALARAREQFEALGARGDLARVERLQERWERSDVA